jgi:hypothetical protein
MMIQATRNSIAELQLQVLRNQKRKNLVLRW